MKMFYLFMYL